MCLLPVIFFQLTPWIALAKPMVLILTQHTLAATHFSSALMVTLACSPALAKRTTMRKTTDAIYGATFSLAVAWNRCQYPLTCQFQLPQLHTSMVRLNFTVANVTCYIVSTYAFCYSRLRLHKHARWISSRPEKRLLRSLL